MDEEVKQENLNYFYHIKEQHNERIKKILESIVHNPEKVHHDQYWKLYYRETTFDTFKRITLKLIKDKNGWGIKLALYLDSQEPAKIFYELGPPILKLKILESQDWVLDTNFWVYNIQHKLIWFKSNIHIEDYIGYWIKNTKELKERTGNEAIAFLKELIEGKIINIDELHWHEKIDENWTKVRISPGIVIKYSIPSKLAIEKDKAGELEKFISKKFKEALSRVNLDWKEILK
jgi:hypothetical protein